MDAAAAAAAAAVAVAVADAADTASTYQSDLLFGVKRYKCVY